MKHVFTPVFHTAAYLARLYCELDSSSLRCPPPLTCFPGCPMIRCLRPRSISPVAACLLVAALATPADVQGDVRVPHLFGDHMVIQRDQPIRIWGWADEGESVTIQLGQQTIQAIASSPAANGSRWEAELPPMEANSNPQTLTIQGNNSIEINDVLIGEVWLCSGQSNMEWTVASSENAKQEIANANHPLIRHIKVPREKSMQPLDDFDGKDFDGKWDVCNPTTAGRFTACGYFMARHLQAELNVPIGLVNSSWGGTRVEPWTPPVGFGRVATLGDIHQSVIQRSVGSDLYRQTLSNHLAATRAWLESAKMSMTSGQRVGPSPAFPAELMPFQSHQDPTMLYNAMIHPIVGFSIRGAIWYQGESNHNEGMLYTEKKKALIGGWRELWKQGDFPFYFVQIAPFQYGNESDHILPEFWEAQAAVEEIANTEMIVINDIATLDNIHPPNKQDVGKRLAMVALRNDYGQEDLVATSPELASHEIVDGAIVLKFNQTGGGLKTRDGEPAKDFELIGAGSGGFQDAQATINGNTVTLRSGAVTNPVAFRFAWNKLAEPNLTGATGLPVGAFRGGEVPQFVDTLPIGVDYQLVYDLDLGKLGDEIQYQVDASDQVGPFDRVAYLLELTTAGGETRQVFVSMNAFTDNVRHIGIPTVDSGASFQQKVESMDVFSSVDGITTGTHLSTGNIEFWPNNYGKTNESEVPGASSEIYDHGDQPSAPKRGYGCMQVHDFAAKQTIFAINHWRASPKADLGIGNAPGQNRDWTFSGNADSYSSKRLRVYVRPTSTN